MQPPNKDGGERPNQDQSIAWTRDHNPYVLAEAAVETLSIPKLSYALDLGRKAIPHYMDEDDYEKLREETFQHIEGGGESQDLLLHMLDKEGFPICRVRPDNIAMWKSPKPIIEALVCRGWDINTPDRSPWQGQPLLQRIIRRAGGQQEDLVRWLIEDQGAKVDIGQFDEHYAFEPHPPPLLETCVHSGITLSLFKFLESKGARHSRRLLHEAVRAAAQKGIDPAEITNARGLVLRYLVDELGCDVNGMDATVDHVCPNTLLGHWGTPLNYAVRCEKGTLVVRWLLGKGADPTIRCPFSSGRDYDAFAYAKGTGCDENLKILEQWMCEGVYAEVGPSHRTQDSD